MVAKEVSRASFDEVVEMVGDYGGADSTDLLVLSTDAKGIVMRQDDLREATKRKAESSRKKLETRLSGGEKRNSKRMAQVAAVDSVGPWVRTPEDILHGLRPEGIESKRPKVEAKRVWASVAQRPSEVIREMFEEASRRDPERMRGGWSS